MKLPFLIFNICFHFLSCSEVDNIVLPKETSKQNRIFEKNHKKSSIDIPVDAPTRITLVHHDRNYYLGMDNKGYLDEKSDRQEIWNLFSVRYKVQVGNEPIVYLFDKKKDMIYFITQNTVLSDNTSNLNMAGKISFNTTKSWIFKNIGFKGESTVIDNEFYFSDLRRFAWHNVISSTVTTNTTSHYYTLTFCEKEHFQGRQFLRIVPPNTAMKTFNFANIGFDDLTSSIRGEYL